MTADALSTSTAGSWLKAATRPHRRLVGLSAALVVADVAPAIGFAAGLGLAIGALERSVAEAAPWLALAAASLVLRGLMGQAATLVSARAAAAVKGDVRQGIIGDLFAGRRPAAAALTAVVEAVETLDGYVARFAPVRMAATVSPLIVIAVCALASPVVAGILLLTLIPFIVGMALAGGAAAAESRRQFEALERLSGMFLDRVRALPTLLSFQAEARTTREIARAADELERRTGRVLKVAFVSSAVLEFFSALSVALVAVYCGFNLLRILPFPAPETLDLGRAFFVLALAPEVYAPMRRLAAAYHEKQAAEAAAPSMAAPGPGRPVITPPSRRWSSAPELDFRSVTIRYGDGAPAISDFDLQVPAGAIVALVGPSGSGKTSLLHLLLGLAPLSSGAVRIGGHNLSHADSFAGAVGWASQNPVVAPGALYDNIALARPGASAEAIRDAAARAGLQGDLGRVLDERGGGLSGGERRRLGLARALLSPSRLLLLDEPTANLDPASETAVLEVIRAAAEGRTTLIATHSEAVMALADRVVRL
jgi:ATP-binding cassette subfamily C protein CydD